MTETKELIEQLLKDQEYTKEQYDYDKNVLGRKITVCPVCGNLTLDGFHICKICNWEYDDYADDCGFNNANKISVRKYREDYYENKKFNNN